MLLFETLNDVQNIPLEIMNIPSIQQKASHPFIHHLCIKAFVKYFTDRMQKKSLRIIIRFILKYHTRTRVFLSKCSHIFMIIQPAAWSILTSIHYKLEMQVKTTEVVCVPTSTLLVLHRPVIINYKA